MSQQKDNGTRAGNQPGVPDQGGVGFTRDDAAGTPGAGGAPERLNRQSDDPGQDTGASNGEAWREDVPDASGVGFTPEDGNAGAGAGGSGAGNRQSAEHPATSGVYTNFASAPADSNVNPPGKAQSSHGSATYPVAGGTQGGFEASQRAAESQQAGTSEATGTSNAGSAMGDADTADRGASRREG